ncbi:DOMON-like domain-containing protein [Parasphingopyxis lamellibrachiae]|uniref:DOMON-like domain-containing protein n=1 Tax=Parasphingopyxis lamellibrachiae TaxID=680125 RepID=A0A3D9FEM6_9SPHN|nr:DOMON-like domain-containing protein [Parasphingopyxis lamellibrachiae]RED15516.1 hypothetical protein DFR46_0511 [Parasphingopyxis lamellibrachiae]
MHALVAHPDTPAKAVESVGVQLARGGPRELWLEFHVRSSGALLLPEEKAPVRAGGLWQTTCFELFVQPEGAEQYWELNFSPSFEWAAYRFDRYREGMRALPFRDPEIWISSADKHFFLSIEALPELPASNLRLGASAVIEENDGTKSFWALGHPPGKPDFHHKDCFALQLPAAELS